MSQNPNPIPGFFAYPSTSESAEAVKNGIITMNSTGMVALKSWEECRIGGKLVINEICREIDSAPIFCCDLTGLNHNVMFELGYAISRNKRIWVALDDSITAVKADFQTLKILTTVGYAPYCNSHDLSSKFLKAQPWSDLNETIFEQVIRPALTTAPQNDLFYLKSRHSTEASTVISKEVQNAAKAMGAPLIIDDPKESSVQSLTWYAEHAYLARAVIVHLISPAREGAHLHNAKYSFVAGLAHGLDKPVLMLAQGNTFAPLDYRDMLKNYQTGSDAERHLHAWLVPIMTDARVETKAQKDYLANVKLAQQLVQLKVGEPIAENEADQLVNDYFVETASYREALEGQTAIFVGRKGCGKSANFLKLASDLQSDKRNLVCLIKPLSYEMHGIVELMNRYQSINLKGYAVESIWKFLIYSEIARTAEAAILNRASGQIQECEKNLIALLDKYSDMFRQEFSVRLEQCIGNLLSNTHNIDSASVERNRVAISESLHSGFLKSLKLVLAEALLDRKRIAIVVDNLDKAWDRQSDIDALSEFLLGLLGTAHRVAADFRSVGHNHLQLNVSLAVFIRADIFHRVMQNAREPDKIRYSRLNWNDDEMLIRVIEERFGSSMGVSPNQVWGDFFCHKVKQLSPKDYFLKRIIKRPRDLLVFVKAAISTAVNRRHARIEEADILDAEKQYSQFALDSILVENGVSLKELDQIIYEFVGESAILGHGEIQSLLQRAGLAPGRYEYVLKHLLDLTFLGVEVAPFDFRFGEDHDDAMKIEVLAERHARNTRGERRYQIHQAFWAFLEIRV